MLEEVLLPQTEEKRVWLRVRQPALQAFLAELLNQWQYQPCDEYVADGLLLAEEGALEPPANQQTIWLSSSAYATGGRLRFPLEIFELYALLERRYHTPPRRHLRLNVELPCRLMIEAFADTAVMASLSDRGCRVLCQRELVRDQRLSLEFSLGERPITLAAKVIYCVPRYRGSELLNYDLGLLFDRIDREGQQKLLDYIVASYFIRVGQQLAPASFSEALPCFAVSSGVRACLVGAGLG